MYPKVSTTEQPYREHKFRLYSCQHWQKVKWRINRKQMFQFNLNVTIRLPFSVAFVVFNALPFPLSIFPPAWEHHRFTALSMPETLLHQVSKFPGCLLTLTVPVTVHFRLCQSLLQIQPCFPLIFWCRWLWPNIWSTWKLSARQQARTQLCLLVFHLSQRYFTE